MDLDRSNTERRYAAQRPAAAEMSAPAPNEPAPAPPAADLDPDSLAAIRDLMTQAETPEPPQPSAPPAAPAHEAAAAPRRKAQALPDIAPQAAPASTSAPQARPAPRAQAATHAEATPGLVERAKARVRGYRPTPRHIAIGAAALLILFRPWLVLGLIFLVVFLITGMFLIMGYDGFWRRAMALGRWYARRRPERSAELHAKLDNFAVKWDSVLDRFPEGSVDGLYLPDFGEFAEADARHAAAMERRLDGLRETDAQA